jgi:hypothetical protein
MNNFLVIVLSLLPGLLCIGLAGYLATQSIEGWGWFLFVALVLGMKALRYSDESEQKTTPPPCPPRPPV